MSIIIFGRWNPKLISLLMGIDADPVLSNANRLLGDAHLLFTKKHYATALALAVISFEEIGKSLLITWSNDPAFEYDKSKKHVMKQAAVAALFTGVEVRKRYVELSIDFQNFSDQEHARLHEAIQAGMDTWRPFMTNVIQKVYENVKWSGLYYDPEIAAKGIEPSKVTEANAGEIIAMTFKAFECLQEKGSIYRGRYAFDAMIENVMQNLEKNTLS